MKKLAVLGTLALTLAATTGRADACRCDTTFCDVILTPIAVGVGAGLVGLYGYGTGYYVLGDLEGGEKSTNYYGSELILHGSLGALWTYATIGAARDGDVGGTVLAGSFATLHLTLGTNGLRGLWGHRDEFHPSDTAVTWGIGTLTGVNALVWASGMSERQSRTYGIAEMAINAPFAIGFGSLAKDRFDSGATGPALAYAGLAALSGVYIVHGAKTALFPSAPELDLLGSELSPTAMTDGSGGLAPGLATAGTW